MRPRIVSFVSASGGVGKTKLSLLLAYYLTTRGHNVLFIDMDPSAGASLLVFSEDEYEDYQHNDRTLSYMIRRSLEGANIDLSKIKVRASIGPYSFDFILPGDGDELIRAVDELWETGRPGDKLRKILDFLTL